MYATTTKREVSRSSLWVGLFGGAITWTVHFMAAYAIAEFGCVGGLGERRYGNISLVAWMELAVTVAAFLIAAAATAVAYRNQIYLRSRAQSLTGSLDVERYTARAGFYTSGVFSFVILFESIPIYFYLRSC